MKAQTEAGFLDTLMRTAELMGWKKRYHALPAWTKKGWRTQAQGTPKGFPDLHILRPPRQIVAELKVGRNTPTKEQEEWLADYKACGAETYVWYPEDWPEIERILARD